MIKFKRINESLECKDDTRACQKVRAEVQSEETDSSTKLDNEQGYLEFSGRMM